MSRSPEQARTLDAERLRDGFYRAFDRSRIEALMRLSDQALDGKATLLGEGAHFRAWRLGMAGGELVLKRATDGLGKPGGLERRRWVRAMSQAKGMGGLVPPFEVFDGLDGDGVAIVMPYGAEPLQAAAAHWQPVSDRLEELRRAFAARGLQLMDVPQGRCWNGVPFLYDLSDVSMISF